MPIVKFRRYGGQPADIRAFVRDKQCGCKGPFHRCRNTDILSVLRGCKCQVGRMIQMGGCPCTEDLILDVNVLVDPGIESEFAYHGGGPTGDQIPFINSSGTGPPYLWAFDDGVFVTTSLTKGHYVQGGDNQKLLLTTNPHSGTYHLRSPNSFGVGERNWLSNFRACFTWAEPSGQSIESFYTARVESGLLVTYSVWWAAANAPGSTRTSANVSLRMFFYDATGTFLSGTSEVTDSATLPVAYIQHGMTAIAPTGASYVNCSWVHGIGIGGTGPVNVDVDDFEVIVA